MLQVLDKLANADLVGLVDTSLPTLNEILDAFPANTTEIRSLLEAICRVETTNSQPFREGKVIGLRSYYPAVVKAFIKEGKLVDSRPTSIRKLGFPAEALGVQRQERMQE